MTRLAAAILLVSSLAGAQDPPKSRAIVLKGARIVTMAAAGDIENGQILVVDGRIKAVGPTVEIPADALVIELPRTAVIVPGFIDAHSHLGSSFEVEESTEAVTTHVHAVDAFASAHPDVKEAVSSGVTLAAIAPGNGNLVGGRVALVRLNGLRLDQMILDANAGLKLSLGEEALRRDREPTSRAGAARLLRDALRETGELREALVDRRRPALIHASKASDIARAVETAESHALNAILVHADEARDLAERLRAANVAVAFGPLTVADARERLETPAALARAGVRLAFVTDAPATSPAQLRQTAALAVRHGLDRTTALRGLTIVPAELLGVSARFGTIEAGKDADLVAYTGDPLSLASAVELAIVEGRIVHRRPKK